MDENKIICDDLLEKVNGGIAPFMGSDAGIVFRDDKHGRAEDTPIGAGTYKPGIPLNDN